MTAVAPSPLPFANRLINDVASSSHRSIQNSPRRQNGVAASPLNMRNLSNGRSTNGTSQLGNSGIDAYGDGIKALLADPIKFEPYAKKVTTDETKYKPINPTVEPGQMNGTDGSAEAGVSDLRVVTFAVF
jgi:hypothetical protein